MRKNLQAGDVFNIAIPGGKIVVTAFGRCDVDLVMGPPEVIDATPPPAKETTILPVLLEIGHTSRPGVSG
jgi:hypothetical protein